MMSVDVRAGVTPDIPAHRVESSAVADDASEILILRLRIERGTLCRLVERGFGDPALRDRVRALATTLIGEGEDA